ncbi:MAG: hypothetical protein GX410_11000 [Elusimicrobia bacterium]|nr:hypothetical protein [Elusimicrobiota bacterium]
MRFLCTALLALSVQFPLAGTAQALLLSSKQDTMSIVMPDDWQELKSNHPSLVFGVRKGKMVFAVYHTNMRSMQQAMEAINNEFGATASKGYSFTDGVLEEKLSGMDDSAYIFYTSAKGNPHFRSYFQSGKKVFYFTSDNIALQQAKAYLTEVDASVMRVREEVRRQEEATVFNPITPDGLYNFTLKPEDNLVATGEYNPRYLRVVGRANPAFYLDIRVLEPLLKGEFKDATIQRSQQVIAANQSCQFWKLEAVQLKNGWEAFRLPYVCIENGQSLQRFAYFMKGYGSMLSADTVGLSADVVAKVLSTGAQNKTISVKLPPSPPYFAHKDQLARMPKFTEDVNVVDPLILKLRMAAAILGLWILIRMLFFSVRYLGTSATPVTGYPVYVDRKYAYLNMHFDGRIQGNRYSASLPRPAVTFIFFALLINVCSAVLSIFGGLNGQLAQVPQYAVQGAWALAALGIAGSIIYPKAVKVYDRHGRVLFRIVRIGLTAYSLKNADGKTICHFRKGFPFPVRRWSLHDIRGNRLVYVKEKSAFRSITRRIMGHLFGLNRSSYFIFDSQGRNIGEMKRSPSLGNSYYVNITDRQWLAEPIFLNTCGLDEQVMMAFFLCIDAKTPDRIYPWYE